MHTPIRPSAKSQPDAEGDAIRRLIHVMAALRTPVTGCPWDLVQSHASIAPYAIEEAYEVVDAIERGNVGELCEELGDLLLQVVFHAQLANETGAFSFDDVADGIAQKMIRRHPHVFGASPTPAHAATEVEANWDAIKAGERRDKRGRDEAVGVLADVAVALPGLTRALKLQKRAAKVGFDWGDARLVLAKIREEIDEVEQAFDENGSDALAGEIGDLLFAVVNLARHAGVDPETAVRTTNRKFESRFAFIEEKLAAKGSKPAQSTLSEMDALWNAAKLAGL